MLYYATVSQGQATVDAAFITAGSALLVGLLGGAVGYFLKYYLDRKQAFLSANGSVKRKMYKKYLNELAAINKISTLDPNEVKRVQKQFGESSSEFYSTSVLFASPKVVRAYGDFVRYTDRQQDERYNYELMLKMSRLYVAMRSDIGLSNRGLGRDGELLLRGTINDYDTTVGPYARWYNRLRRRIGL